MRPVRRRVRGRPRCDAGPARTRTRGLLAKPEVTNPAGDQSTGYSAGGRRAGLDEAHIRGDPVRGPALRRFEHVGIGLDLDNGGETGQLRKVHFPRPASEVEEPLPRVEPAPGSHPGHQALGMRDMKFGAAAHCRFLLKRHVP